MLRAYGTPILFALVLVYFNAGAYSSADAERTECRARGLEPSVDWRWPVPVDSLLVVDCPDPAPQPVPVKPKEL